MIPRVVMWVQSRMGVGHLARSLTVCGGLANDGFDVTLVHGGPPAPVLRVPPGVKWVQLPVAVAPNLQSSEIHDSEGRPIDETWIAKRIDALKDVLERTKPHAFLTETFPLGRRIFSFELLPVLAWLRERSPRPLIVSSVRDVVTRPEKKAKAEAMVDLAVEHYDLVICHSDPNAIVLPDAFQETSRLAPITQYTGYVVEHSKTPAGSRRGVIVVAGGGASGQALFSAAVDARSLWPDETEPWTIIAGPRFDPSQLNALRDRAPKSVQIEGAVMGLSRRYANARVAVMQAGYNSVCEALVGGTRLTVVPYATGKETEQTIRAETFSRLGLLTLVREEDLAPMTLVSAMQSALQAGPPSIQLNFDGASGTARVLRQALKTLSHFA